MSTDQNTKCQPLSDENWPPNAEDLKDGFAGALNVYRTMAHHPQLLKAWAPLRQHIVKDSELGPINSELVILRTGYRLGSAYEWAHHVSRARQLGMSDERISAMRGSPSGLDGLIAEAVDALFDVKKLPRDIESRLSDAIGQQAVFDLVATVGFYSVLGFILMTYDTPIDPGILNELQRSPLSCDV